MKVYWSSSSSSACFDRRVRGPLIVAALLRLTLMVTAFAITGTRVMTQGDTTSYLEPGRNLIFHGAFTASGMPEIDRTPGYPLFAEITGMVSENVLLTAVAQVLLSLVSLLLVRKIADQVFPDRNAGVIAAWLYAIEPLSIVYTCRLMPETLFVLVLLLVMERLMAFTRTGKLAMIFAAAVLLAAATFVRPVSYYLGFALAAGLAITASPRRGLWWKAPAVLLLGFLPWLAAWQIRNRIESGYGGFSSIVEKNLYFFQSAEVTAESQHISLDSEQKALGYPEDQYYLAAHPEQRAWSRAQRLQFMRAQALKILAAHPWLYLKTHLAGVGVVAFTPCATEPLQLLGAYPAADTMPHRILNQGIAASVRRVLLTHPGVTIAMALLEGFLLTLYALAIRGCLVARRKNVGMLILLGIAAYFLLISGGAQAVGRYRLPVMPELCILAAGGLAVTRNEKCGARSAPHLGIAP